MPAQESEGDKSSQDPEEGCSQSARRRAIYSRDRNSKNPGKVGSSMNKLGSSEHFETLRVL